MNQLPMFDEPAKDLRDEIIGRLTLQLEKERQFNRKIVDEFNHLLDNLQKLNTGARWFCESWMDR